MCEFADLAELTQAATQAAGRGEEAALLAWLDSGGRINATCAVDDVSGVTALILAADSGHERVVELLLERGAEINLQGGDGGTALMYAATNVRAGGRAAAAARR